LWAIVRLIERTAFFRDAQWMEALCAFVLLLACVIFCACHYLDIRWLLCAVCLFGVLFLQDRELGQQELHQHGRIEHVRVQQIQWSAGDGINGSVHVYTVTVLDGPPLAPIEETGLMGWQWVVGGSYTVTVDPQGRVPLRRGGNPGPPVTQQLLQIPLGLGLAFALRRPAHLLLQGQRVPSDRPVEGP
jgi:hypothetical protein